MKSLAEKVLVVDDDPDIVALVQIVLGEDGYEVAAAHNGREALDCLTDGTPDLILLDLAMPVMNGWEFLDAVQDMSLAQTASIVIMTASPLAEGRSWQPSVAGHLPKPFDLDDLVRCAARHTGRQPALAAG